LHDGVARVRMHAMTHARADADDSGDLTLQFTAPDAATLAWSGARIALTPQHPDSPGATGRDVAGIGGVWIEDAAAPSLVVAVEDLGERVFAAALLDDAWCVTVARRRERDDFEGEWLRFEGGQAWRGAYRAPAAPSTLGSARLLRLPTDRLVVQLAGGAHRVLVRAPCGVAAEAA
jgi:hypothetical protein